MNPHSNNKYVYEIIYGKLSWKNRLLCSLKKKKLNRYLEESKEYIKVNYTAPDSSREAYLIRYCLDLGIDEGVIREDEQNNDIRYSDRNTNETQAEDSINIRYSKSNIKYSEKRNTRSDDSYDAVKVSSVLRNYSSTDNFSEAIKNLEQVVNQTFVDKLLYYIDKKGLLDSRVYKAAQVDKRLFSKIVSNRQYKPSKDTAVALSLALELSLDEANDILSRAGYTLSHSSMRDVIIEYFFREKIYNLMDLNYVLYSCRQKLIGRS